MSTAQNFWSRRKAAVEAEEQDVIQAQTDAEDATARQALDEKSDDEILDALELPDPDSLGLGDDFSGFMAKAVPERLQRRALRRLWLSNPALANLDSLVDYGEDFTDAATVVENMQTTYQVGKGMLTHVQEMLRQAEELAAEKTTGTDGTSEGHDADGLEKTDDSTGIAAADEAETAATSDAGIETASLALDAPQTVPHLAAEHAVDAAILETDLPQAAPGRMRFDFA